MALVQVVAQATGKPPAGRFPDAEEMAAAAAGHEADALVVRQEADIVRAGSFDPGSRSRPACLGRTRTDSVLAAGVDDAKTGADAGSPSASLQQIERRLAHHVGAMARYHLRRGPTIAGIEELCAKLADIPPDMSASGGQMPCPDITPLGHSATARSSTL